MQYLGKVWSAYERVITSKPRTTNTNEAWHKGLKNKIGISHPNFGRFLNSLQKEEELVRCGLLMAENGILEFPRQNFQTERKIFIVVSNYANFEEYGFFDALEGVVAWKE